MKTISTNGLTARIRKTIKNSETNKDLVRSIDESWARDIAEAVRTVLKQRTAADVEAVIRVFGGFVANSYGYRSMADRMLVVVNLVTGEIKVGDVARTVGCNRKFGRGSCISGRLLKADQIQGRIVY